MVTKYGMGSSKLGQVSLDYEDDGRSISSETRAAIEEETRALVQAAYERAKVLLKKHEAQLHVLAASLIDKETLSGDEIKVLLNMPLDHPPPAATQTAAKKAHPSGQMTLASTSSAPVTEASEGGGVGSAAAATAVAAAEKIATAANGSRGKAT
jgi:hypothetical protein